MPRFNPQKYRLTGLFDPLYGKNPDDYPEQTRFRDLHTIKDPGDKPVNSAPINNALAGRRVRGSTPTRGGGFAPRATSGMS